MAQTLAGYLSKVTTVLHARELGLHTKTDIEWIQHLHDTREEWLVVTGDGRIHRNRAEREAFRRAGLRGVVLNPAYQKTPMGRCCGMIVFKWDELIAFTNKIDPPFLVEMSINLSSRFKILPI